MALSELQMAKASLLSRNWLTDLKFANQHVLRLDLAWGMMRISEPDTTEDEAKAAIKKMVDSGYLKPVTVGEGWIATSEKSYKSVGSDAEPWKGWIEK